MRCCCVALRSMSRYLKRSMTMREKSMYTCMYNWVPMLYSGEKNCVGEIIIKKTKYVSYLLTLYDVRWFFGEAFMLWLVDTGYKGLNSLSAHNWVNWEGPSSFIAFHWHLWCLCLWHLASYFTSLSYYFLNRDSYDMKIVIMKIIWYYAYKSHQHGIRIYWALVRGFSLYVIRFWMPSLSFES